VNLLPNLVELIQKIAMRVIDESQPAAVVFGTVVSASPLRIQIEQKLTLETAHLVLTNNVKDHEVHMTVDHQTENAEGHQHGYKGKKKFIIHNNLLAGEKVVLLRMQGGQKFIVLDRAVM
jgi:Protein of unknown function (DUF2577)